MIKVICTENTNVIFYSDNDCFFYNADLPGDDLSYFAIGTVEECQARCQRTEECVQFTMYNGMCHLKNGFGGGNVYANTFDGLIGAVSGPMSCGKAQINRNYNRL